MWYFCSSLQPSTSATTEQQTRTGKGQRKSGCKQTKYFNSRENLHLGYIFSLHRPNETRRKNLQWKGTKKIWILRTTRLKISFSLFEYWFKLNLHISEHSNYGKCTLLIHCHIYIIHIILWQVCVPSMF